MSTPVDTPADSTRQAGSSSTDSPPLADSGDDMSTGRWVAVFVMVAVILGGFAVLMLYMLATSGDKGVSENVWGRRLYVYGSAEAITFTAVGWLFGREVHRSTAKVARKQAADASADAKDAHRTALAKTDEAARASATGEVVARAIIASANNAASPRGRPVASFRESLTNEPAGSALSSSQLDSLKDLVMNLYPHLT